MEYTIKHNKIKQPSEILTDNAEKRILSTRLRHRSETEPNDREKKPTVPNNLDCAKSLECRDNIPSRIPKDAEVLRRWNYRVLARPVRPR